MAVVMAGCGTGAQSHLPNRVAPAPKEEPPPSWVWRVEIERDRLCGLGVAGAGFDANSPYPRQLAEERAIRNLAGILGTEVREAIIDHQDERGTNVELARHLQVDDALVALVAQLVETNFWTDWGGRGPYAQKGFTYAHSCIDAGKAAAALRVDAGLLLSAHAPQKVGPQRVPAWVNASAKQPDGRLCAVGYSLPMFFADKTFESVVEDVRIQLAEVIQTLVASYYEELVSERSASYEAMTVATTEAVSKGAVVTDFWYDRDGIGPNKQPRSTYGFGCVYPVQVIDESLAVAQEAAPDDKDAIARVRERAKHAFEDLDEEIEKHGQKAAPASAAPAAPSLAEPTPPSTPPSVDAGVLDGDDASSTDADEAPPAPQAPNEEPLGASPSATLPSDDVPPEAP